jgi:serine/threonine protein kinase
VGVALQVLDTLEYLHHLQPPVIYRDLKPSNIMVTADGEAKLIDFGIARHFHPLSNATMIGTQGYAPPEQYRGKVETRSDIYSLGATMHHAISGRDPAAEPPFSFPPLQKFAPDVDPRLASAVDQALAYDVGSRLRDAAEFKFRLFQISDDAVSASARGSAQNNQPGRTQLPLPLGDGVVGSAANPPPNNQFQGRLGVPPLGPSAGAPTVLSTNIEISCPQCTRRIPGDSRFCSYCACKLHLLAQPAGGAAPDDETVVLSGGHSPAHVSSPSVRSSVARNASAPSRRRRALRRPFLLLAVIFAAGVIAAELIKSALNNENPAPPGYRTGSDEGPDAMPRAPGEYSNYSDYDSAVMRSRLIQLRARLDTGGYSTVRFRLEGDTLILYGSVHSEYDRLAVQAICFATVGLTSLSDDLKVSDGDTED